MNWLKQLKVLFKLTGGVSEISRNAFSLKGSLVQ
jgi:hypothetical protein